MDMTKYNKNKPALRAKNGGEGEAAKSRYQSMYAKCTNQGREAAVQGDNVEAERFFQQAEHYLRLMNQENERRTKVTSSTSPQPAKESSQSVEEGTARRSSEAGEKRHMEIEISSQQNAGRHAAPNKEKRERAERPEELKTVKARRTNSSKEKTLPTGD